MVVLYQLLMASCSFCSLCSTSGQNPTLGTRALSDRCHAVAVIPRMPMLACKRSWEVSG
jgi:hypothetical protein